MLKKLFQFMWDLVEVLIIIYVIFVTTCILSKNRYGYTNIFGYTLVSVHQEDEAYIKDSKAGNLLVVKNDGNVNKNQYVYYYYADVSDPNNEKYVVRGAFVTDTIKGDGGELYSLKDKEDPKISKARVLGNYSNQYAVIGGVLEFLETRLGFLFCVLLPIMIVFVYQIYEFVVILNYDKADKIRKSEEEIDRQQEKIRLENMKKKEDDNIEIL
jgi:hypothetical protein